MTHGASVPGGVFEHEVEERGHVLERWSVPDGVAPDRPRAYDAVMVFGGAAHPDQDDHFAWLAHEEEFLREALAAEIPAFGVCLGAQMLARAGGGRVGPARAPEIGWYDVELTAEARTDPVLRAMPPGAVVFQWHRYTYEIPPGGIELARSPVATQSFHLPPAAWAIQFHAEVTLPMLSSWIAEDPGELLTSPAALLEESERRIAASNELGRALCAAFLARAER